MYILVDLEATCWITPPRPKIQKPELIEFAAIAFDDDCKIIDTFHIFIKPEINPVLSESCRKLTNILQEDVDKGFVFSYFIELFQAWLTQFKDCKMLSWGDFDRIQLLKEMKYKKLKNQFISFYEFLQTDMKTIDILFQKKFNLTKGGLFNTLQYFKIETEGLEHRAIDDVKNTYNLVEFCYDKIKEDLKNL